MKKRFILTAALCSLLLASCLKEDDFSELKHPLQLQGDFDPAIGLPVAKMSADMSTLLGMLHTSENMSVFVDSSEQVAFLYQDTLMFEYSYTETKAKSKTGAKDGYGDSIVLDCQTLEGSTDIDLFQKLTELGNGNIEAKGLYVTLTADMKTRVSDNILALVDHGVHAFFDCDTLFVTCQDGTEWTIGLGRSMGRVNVKDLVEGKRISVAENYDLSHLVNRKPTQIRYSAKFYIVAPPDIDFITCMQYINDSLYIDNLSTKMATIVNFPLQLYCKDIVYYDTIKLNSGQMDEVLDVIDQYMTLNDTANQLIFTADNSFPIALSLNAVCLDSNRNAISAPLITADSLLAGAPLKSHSSNNSYISNGSSQSRITVPITRDILDKLNQAKYLRLSIGANTSTQGATENKPTVMVLGKDRLDLKLYVKLSPQIHLNISL